VNFLAISHTSYGGFRVPVLELYFGGAPFTDKKFMTKDGWIAKFTF